MTFPQTLTVRFFQLINSRQFTEAQRTLQRIKTEIQENEWNHGYYRGLYGMLLAQKTNGNQYSFLSNINPNDKTAIKQHKNEFLRRVQGRFHDDFDRGFFSAWTDYTRLLIKTIDESKPKMDPEGQTSIIQYAESIRKPA